MKSKKISKIFFIVCLILLVPLFGNVFVDGWNWGVMDFVFAGALFFATGLSLDFVLRTFSCLAYRIALSVAILSALFLVWIQLAVDGVSQLLALIF